MVTPGELRAAFEHCDPARYFDFFCAVRKIMEDNAPDRLSRIGQLLDAASDGTGLYMARVKGGFADDE